ncbi:MAG: DUF5677 domain-containing protein [Candidatus Sulfotelmatobacter sp.]
MPAEALFVRDPREVPFLREQVGKVLALAHEASRSIPIQESDDFGFMAVQFLYKQMQHGESVLSLVPRRDAGLIARTMIDGLYQLLWAFQAREERAKRWRLFSIIYDWRRIQGQLKLGIPVDGEHIRRTESLLKVLGNTHRIKKLKPNSHDLYHKRWHGGITLADMADDVSRELYDGPYAELSDWEHWGVGGIGESIERENSRVIVNTDSDRTAGVALLAAFQCLLQTLVVADIHLRLRLRDAIQTLGEDFRKTLDSFY